MTSRYRGENAVPLSPRGMGIAPIIDLSVVNETSLIADPPPFSWFWIKRIALNCPQRAQCCFLRLGHSPDPCDIEALVGAVASQRPHQLGALDVPHLDGTILPATDQQTAIGADLKRVDGSLMRLSHCQTCPTLYLPPA